ncbi:MAG: TonB-dependent receptor [Bacteroidetes bacterium]|nr:TonB-dependent receptor [Bacteroidota bacterium]
MKKTIIRMVLYTGIVFTATAVNAQNQEDSTEIESMDEALISGQRLGQTRRNSTRQIEVIDGRKIALAQQPTMAEVLSQTGQVFVQKSQLGGGSPVVRGFEASRVLMVVDGVRMNNATYRAGHLQDVITVDPYMLERTEVLFGSGSTLYGSDALGGVIYFKTRDPKFRDHKFGLSSANVNSRYMTAYNGWQNNFSLEFSGRKVAWLVNATYSDFGDLRSGQQRNFSGRDTFGYRGYYIDRINGRDTQLKNTDPFVQIGTAYKQADILTKVSVKTGNFTHMLNLQVSRNPEIPRYDRLTDVRNGALRFATWSYTPQNRDLISYTLTLPETAKLRHRLIIASQGTEVGRVTRSFRNDNEKTQLDKVRMNTINYDLVYDLGKWGKLNGGAEIAMNKVSSSATNLNVMTGVKTDIKDTRYADGGASTNSMAVYANMSTVLTPDDLILEYGFRITQYNLTANFSTDNFLKLPYTKAENSSLAPVFHAGLTKKLDMEGLYLKASVSNGFRNPNVDDMTKLFESVSGSKLVIPNKDLKPERTTTSDLGISYTGGNMRFEGGAYYTHISNLLIDQKARYNGMDSFMYDGKQTPVYQMANTAGGYVTGLYMAAKFRIIQHLYADMNYTSTYGRYRSTEQSAWQPLDHVAPDHGRAGLRWSTEAWQLEAFMLFNGWKRAREYSPSGEDNVQYSAGGQTRSWQTWNLRALWKAHERLSMGFSLENILDLHYRVFSSGMSAPGRNLTISLKASL